MLDGGLLNDAVGELLSQPRTITRDSIGGSTLIQQLDRYELTPQFYNSMLISVDALGPSGEGDVDEINAMNALNASGEFLYVVPSINAVLTAGSANRISLDAIFDGIETAYPDQFVNSILTAVHYTDGTPNDAADAANLIWPRSLRGDSIHLNSAGRALLARIIVAKLVSMGLDGNRPAENLATPRIGIDGADLEAFPGVWAAFPAATATYQWYADDVAISGATSATYTTAGTETDVVFTVAVTYTNAGGSDTATSPGVIPYRTEFTSYSAETNALLNAMDSAPTVEQQDVIDIQMARVQALAAKLDWFSAPLHSDFASRINWLDPTKVATAYLSPTFTTGRGWTMDRAVGNWIETNWVPSTAGGAWTQTSAHLGVHVDTPDFQDNAGLISNNGGVGLLWRQETGASVDIGSTSSRLNSGALPASTMGGRDGHLVITRSSNTVKPYRNGYSWETGDTDTANTLSTLSVRIGGDLQHEGIIGAFHFGGHLDAADVVELTDIIADLRAAFGPTYGAGEYDPDAVALFDAMDVEPSSDLKDIYHDAIVAMKNAGIWHKYECLYFLNAHDEQAARLNVVAPGTYTATNSGASFTAYEGFTGNGSSAFLDTGYNPSLSARQTFLYTQSAMVWALKSAVDARSPIGYASSASTVIRPRVSGDSFQGRIAATSFTTAASAEGAGLWRGNRIAFSSGAFYKDGASFATFTTSGATSFPNENLLLLRESSGYYGGGIAFAGYGYPFSPDEAAAEYSILYAFKLAVEAL